MGGSDKGNQGVESGDGHGAQDQARGRSACREKRARRRGLDLGAAPICAGVCVRARVDGRAEGVAGRGGKGVVEVGVGVWD